jgi:patatin-like phospholipase/acyl hydrolase
MKRFILTIDGGGIRGIVPAMVLVALERTLKAIGKNDALHKYCDLSAGTSTGAIIAAGLTCPNPHNAKKPAASPETLAKLYLEDGPKIFEETIIDKLRSGFGLGEERYSADFLETRLKDMLGTKYQISDALTKVLITAYDIKDRAAVFMTNTDKENANFLFWQAVRGSSAAPTYFEPALVEDLSSLKDGTTTSLPLIDGGTFANDPTMAAYIEARKKSWPDEDLTILSIGTGHQNREIPYQQAKKWGAWGWIDPSNDTPIISILMQGQASTTSYQMNKLLNPQGTRFVHGATEVTSANASTLRYFRINGPLVKASDSLDDTTPGNMRELSLFAEKLIRDFQPTLDEIAKRLAS